MGSDLTRWLANWFIDWLKWWAGGFTMMDCFFICWLLCVFFFAFLFTMCSEYSEYCQKIHPSICPQERHEKGWESYQIWHWSTPDSSARAEAGSTDCWSYYCLTVIVSLLSWKDVFFDVRVQKWNAKPCQHLGGTSTVERIMESVLNGSSGSGDPYVAMVDLLGYDAWPSTYALHQGAAGGMIFKPKPNSHDLKV